MKNLYESLKEYQSQGYYPMHMPGHKRNKDLFTMENPYSVDITEVEGFDDLHEAKGILKVAMERGAKVYRSEETHFLVNGSTVGLLTGIAACTKKGDRVLVARNCHKAVYNGIFLNELRPIYIYPQNESLFGMNGGILEENVREMLITYPDIKLIIITSPTYEGILSDIEKIAAVSHAKGIPLMVDEAHGAHLGFHSYFPENAIGKGADLVIHSVHKTLPAFTQSALLHVNGSFVNRDKIKDYLRIYQSSSPSYLLMAGIDQCMELIEKQGAKLFEDYRIKLEQFYREMEELKNLRVLQGKALDYTKASIYDVDPSKIIISTRNTSLTGPELYDELLIHDKIQLELVSADYAIAMTSIGDTKEGFDRLTKALIRIDGEIISVRNEKEMESPNIILEIELSPYEAYNREGETVTMVNSLGRISKEYAYLYPPGIPLLVPGERITAQCLALLQYYKDHKLMVKGLKKMDCIQVVS